jgi:hypothetical protein
MRRSLLPFLVLFALLTSSCGSSSTGGPAGSADDTGAPGDLDAANGADVAPGDTDNGDTGSTLGEYPPGPYGTKTGDILADFEISGYLNLDPSQVSTTAEYKTVKLSDVRAAAKVPYLFIHEVGFY